MLRHHLILAFRHLLRQRTYAFINLLGLSLGVACTLLILHYIQFELSFDRFHPEATRIYRVVQSFGLGSPNRMSSSGYPMGPGLVAEFPQVEAATRFHRKGGLVSRPGEAALFREPDIVYADSNFFQFFAFGLPAGQAAEALRQPGQVVLTEAAAARFFGDEDPIGQRLLLDQTHPLLVTAVVPAVPSSSHFGFDLVVSLSTLHSVYNTETFDSWWWPQMATYVRLQAGADVKALNEALLPAFIQTYREPGLDIYPWLQPLTQIRLYGQPEGEGTIRYVYIFAAIALIVLLIACFNFMNLATARATTRALEVGVRKAIGATRPQLTRQFLGESFLLTSLAVLLGLGLAEWLLPLFNRLAGTALELAWDQAWLWLSLGLVVVVVGLLAGSYPAAFLSRYEPVHTMKGSTSPQTGGRRLRQVMVTAQFTLSVGLIICTTLIWQQHRYLLDQDLGFDQAQLVNLELAGAEVRTRYPALKQALLQLPGVEAVSGSSWSPGDTYMVSFPGQIEGAGRQMANLPLQGIIYADHDFLRTTGIALAAGRDFDPARGQDRQEAFILSAAAATAVGDSGSLLQRQARIFYTENGEVIYEKKGQVIGLTEDFHSRDLRQPLGPVIINLTADDWESRTYYFHCLVRLAPGQGPQALAAIAEVWEAVNGSEPLELTFADARLAEAYAQEATLGQILTAFALLAIFIACLGLLGLVAFTAQQRTKELGIRKVLGASSGQLLLLLNREFSLLIGLASLVAAPTAFLIMSEWLSAYPYRIGFSPWPYLGAGLGALGIAWLVAGWQAWAVARRNPAEALRHE